MKNNADSVSFIGLGYVGLCTATVLATRGIRTIGIDIDSEKIEKISKGQPPIHEPQLRQTLKAALKQGQFSATTETSRAADTGITFLTVGTPSKPDGSIDLAYVKKATEDLGRAIKDKATYHLVAVKSTVTPGTSTNIVKPVLEKGTGKSIGRELGLASNPEFLKEGSAIQDTFHPDKVVIGATDKKSAETLKQLYKIFYKNKLPPVIETTPETAELIKYASNSFLATKVSFINTIANICQRTPGTDVETIAKAIGLDPRIGPLFLKAGPGYGGSCFHKDLQALISYSQARGYDPVLVKTTEEVNQQQAGKVVELTKTLLGDLENKRVAVLGLAFKKDTDDIREAASLRVIDQLRRQGAQVVTYDPQAMPNAKKVITAGVEFAPDPCSALRGADGCIIMTEWDEIKRLRPKDYLQHMKTPAIVDARKLYKPKDFRELDFVSIGLGPRNYVAENAQNKPDSRV